MHIDHRRVLRPFRQVCAALAGLPGNPTPQQVHRLRIRLRRVEAALNGLGLDSRKHGRRAVRDVKSLLRRTGVIHDMDVLTTLAGPLDAPECEDCRIELLEYLGAERYRQARKLRDSVRKHGEATCKELRRCAVQIEKRIGTRAPVRDRFLAAAAITARIVELGSELARYPRLARSNLHRFRIRAKHLRYLLKLAGEGDTAFFCALDEVKDRIGEWHDWERLMAIARSLDRQPGRRRLLGEIRKITEQKFQHVLETPQRFRDQQLARLFAPQPPARGQIRAASGPRRRAAA